LRKHQDHPAAARRPTRGIADWVGKLRHGRQTGGVDPAGGDRVDGDVVTAELDRQRAQRDDRSLGRAVGQMALRGDERVSEADSRWRRRGYYWGKSIRPSRSLPGVCRLRGGEGFGGGEAGGANGGVEAGGGSDEEGGGDATDHDPAGHVGGPVLVGGIAGGDGDAE
jgi:hypothetical protein